MKIYTRTGDRGKTSLFDNTRVWKNSLRVDTYGTIDELNSMVGVVVAYLDARKTRKRKYLSDILLQIQKDLFAIGSSLATPGSRVLDFDITARITLFENSIDEMTEKLPELTNFILPGGSVIGAHLHAARTISRRAERHLVSLILEEEIDPLIISYVNRLSDLLFTMSRFANNIEHKKETIWQR